MVVGRYPGVAVVRTGEALPPTPSTLVEHWIRPTGATHTYLSSSTVHTAAGSWGAFAHWEDGELKRSFSATQVHIIEDLGLPQVWERPYWAGEHPAPPVMDVLPDPQTLPFDPARSPRRHRPHGSGTTWTCHRSRCAASPFTRRVRCRSRCDAHRRGCAQSRPARATARRAGPARAGGPAAAAIVVRAAVPTGALTRRPRGPRKAMRSNRIRLRPPHRRPPTATPAGSATATRWVRRRRRRRG